MQEPGDRRVLWNFEHVVPGSTGTIEFRGGRGLRGPVRTKWWIAFVIAFVNLCAPQIFHGRDGSERPSTDEFWAELKQAAKEVQVDGDLPRHWQHLNETRSASSMDMEDVGEALDSEESEASSIISKDASEYEDSVYSTEDEEKMVEELYRERNNRCVIL